MSKYNDKVNRYGQLAITGEKSRNTIGKVHEQAKKMDSRMQMEKFTSKRRRTVPMLTAR